MDSKKQLEIAVKAADGKRAENIVALDMQKVSLLADYFVMMDANSQRQVQAIVDAIVEAEQKADVKVKNVEGKDAGNWVLIDMGDVVVHVFQKETRAHYNLEKLWADAPMMDEINNWVEV